jgi:nucleotide-binding universal stress UspA family protein
MYKRILVATGGSPWSTAAVTYAIALAAHTGAELRLLTVLVLNPVYALPDITMASDLVMSTIEHEGQMLLEQVAAQAERAGVEYIALSSWGNVPQTILETAAAEDCDLIVLGSRGLLGWKRLMLGSISNVVAVKAERPVLIVKRPPLVAPGTPPWRRILVATGGSPWSNAAVDYALQLAHAQSLEVCLLHVERARGQRNEDAADAEGKRLLTLAENRAAAAGVTYDARLAFSGDIAGTILDTANTKQCDAIILGSRGLTGWKRLMLGSISNAVAAKAEQPVLIVKRFLQP